MKKFFAFVLAMVMVACMFTACSSTLAASDSQDQANEVQIELADLAQVPGYDYLYYSTSNQTVYYLFEQRGYKRGQIVEVADGEIVAVVSMYELENNTEIVLADLAPIPGYDYLYYSLNTHTVYYLFRTSGYESRMGFMEAYTSNSHYCEYIDGEIVEVIPEPAIN